MFLFGITLVLFFVTVSYLRKIPSINELLTRLDSALFRSFFVQSLLQATVQLESGFFSRNLFITVFSYFIYMLLLHFYLDGLFFFTHSFDSVDILEVLNMCLVLWTSFYLKLRMTSLNYVNLEINTSTISWNTLISIFKQKEKLDFINLVPSEAPVALVSLKHDSYIRVRESFNLDLQKRGVKTIARTVSEAAQKAAKASAKATGENSDASIALAGVAITSGTAIYIDRRQTASQNRANELAEKHIKVLEDANRIQEDTNKITERHVDVMEKANKLASENTPSALRRSETLSMDNLKKSLSKSKSDLSTQKEDPSEYFNIPRPIAETEADGKIKVAYPKNDLEDSPSDLLKKDPTKDVFFVQGDRPSVVRLDGSIVDDIFSFFV